MIWLLLILYQIKHFICDFPLQGKYMMGKFKAYPDFILPLLAHASVHGVATFLIASIFKPKIAFWIALFDTVIHFTVDRIKASPDLLGRFKALSSTEYAAIARQLKDIDSKEPATGDTAEGFKDIKNCANERFKSNKYFWWALGLDQGLHHLTHYAIIWSLL